MKISEQGKQQVRPREFWLAVGGVTLLLGVMGICFMQTGRMPKPAHWLDAGVLLLIWGGVLWDLTHHGRNVFPPWRAVSLLGFSLVLGNDLMPSLERASWPKAFGGLLTLVMLWPRVEFGKRHSSPPTDAPPTDAPPADATTRAVP